MNKSYSFSYDGKGINDKSDSYSPRIATFVNSDMADKYGKLLELAPEMLSMLEYLQEKIDFKSQITDAKMLEALINKARKQ